MEDKKDIVVYSNVINLEGQFYNKFCEKTPCFSFGQDYPESDINQIINAWKELKQIREKNAKQIREKNANTDDYFIQAQIEEAQIEFVSRKIILWSSDIINIDKIMKLQESDIINEYATKIYFDNEPKIWCCFF